MTSAERVQAPREGARHLLWAFAIIIGGFLLANAVSIYVVRTALSEVSLISEHALNSTELASRLSRNLYKKRLLIEAHIFAKDTISMQNIEGELVGVDAVIEATSLVPMNRSLSNRASVPRGSSFRRISKMFNRASIKQSSCLA